MNIILFGFKSVGKTYIGKLLAKTLNISFIDTDELLSKKFNMPCNELYKQLGSKSFLQEEKKVILSLKDTNNSVISCGGQTLLDNDNYLFLKKLGKLVFLKAKKQTLEKRIFQSKNPSFLKDKNIFDKEYNKRKSIYSALEATQINIDNLEEKEIIDILTNLYSKEVKNGK